MSRRWRLAPVLALVLGLAGLGCYQYLRLQAALPPPLQWDPRQAEYQALQRLVADLTRTRGQPAELSAEVKTFRMRQETLAKLRTYALSSPFRSELLLAGPTSAWTEAWISGPHASRLYEGLSGEPTWILTVANGERWSLQVRSLESPAPGPDTVALNRHLMALLASSAACALVLGFAWGKHAGRQRESGLQGSVNTAWDTVRTDLGALDEAMSDHIRLRGELARQSEELAVVTEAVRQRREQRRRSGQPA